MADFDANVLLSRILTDQIGLTSPATGTLTVTPTLSVEIPDPPTIDSVVDNQTGNSIPIEFNGRTNDATPLVSGSGAVANGAVTIYDKAVKLGVTTANATGVWTYLTPALTNDNHILTATTSNAAGESAESNFYNFAVDTSAPAAPIITDVIDNFGGVQGSVGNGSSTDDLRPQIVGTSETNATISIYDNAALITSVVADGAGAWTWTPLSDLSVATHVISATATDDAGNTGNFSTTRTFTCTVVSGGDTIMPGAAQFLSEKTFEISSLDTGMFGVVEPWGGNEFGHSYKFSLTGSPPAGVTIESDAGVLSNSAALAAGTYTFNVVVNNIKDPTKVSTFELSLVVRQGVTSNRTGNQILHKDYVVSSGTYGDPSGNNYSAVLTSLRNAVIADQLTHGDNNLCAVIIFNAGTQYDYDNNRWTFGIQRLRIRTTVAGSQATLRCIAATSANIGTCQLQMGRGWANDMQYTGSFIGDASKKNAYFINSVSAGSTAVTLKNAADAARFVVGRWAAVVSYDQQGGGFPANGRFVDYVKVTGKSGAIITFDRKLRWSHQDDHWENAAHIDSLGKARLVAVDRDVDNGGQAGTVRTTLRVHMNDINFGINPNVTQSQIHSRLFFYAEALEQYYKNCSINRFCLSQARHAILDGCVTGASELDKLSTRFVMIGGNTKKDGGTGIYMGTGIELVLMKNVDALSGYIMPMQHRIIGGTMAGSTYRPLVCGGSSTQQVATTGVAFTAGAGAVIQNWDPSPITVGQGGITYSAGVLTVPTTATNFLYWIRVTWVGSFIYVGSVGSARVGYITAMRGNAASTATIYNVSWLTGAAPTTGDVLVCPRMRELVIDGTGSVSGGAAFNASAHTVKQITPGVTTRNFPAGYPAATYGF